MGLEVFFVEQNTIAEWIFSAFLLFVLMGAIVVLIFLISRKQIMSDAVQLKK